jgi:hypothetical protein
MLLEMSSSMELRVLDKKWNTNTLVMAKKKRIFLVYALMQPG